MILLIDNYDSFTYNLYQYIGSINPDIKVVRNDKITVDEIRALAPTHLVISPGPKYPKDAGVTIDAIRRLSGELPILGICLGHQAIGEAFGGVVVRAKEIIHGKQCAIKVDNTCPLFAALPQEILAARYHSLIIDKESLPDSLRVTAEDHRGEIMGVQHKQHKTYGVQFHPESVLTPLGMEMIKSFLTI